MILRPRISLALTALALTAAALGLSGCSSDSTPTPTSRPTPTLEPYDSNRNMWRIFASPDHIPGDTQAAVQRAAQEGDASQTAVIVEILRFWTSNTLNEAYGGALQTFTGQDFFAEERPWHAAMEWLGPRRAEFPPPDEYPEWKADLLSIIDPRMAAFLTAAPGSERVDLTEIVWGGVRTDGIPDLQFPPTLTPEEAAYLHPRDRVFGVSINGEHRAYPLRILNAHEMANDTLGGEQFALAY